MSSHLQNPKGPSDSIVYTSGAHISTKIYCVGTWALWLWASGFEASSNLGLAGFLEFLGQGSGSPRDLFPFALQGSSLKASPVTAVHETGLTGEAHNLNEALKSHEPAED